MRLIDADALDAEMYRKSFEVDDGRNVWNSGLWIRYKIFEEAIRDAPTIDAVPVIRCMDCKHFTGKWCILNSRKEFDPEDRLVNVEGFCAWAERKEHEID